METLNKYTPRRRGAPINSFVFLLDDRFFLHRFVELWLCVYAEDISFELSELCGAQEPCLVVGVVVLLHMRVSSVLHKHSTHAYASFFVWLLGGRINSILCGWKRARWKSSRCRRRRRGDRAFPFVQSQPGVVGGGGWGWAELKCVLNS